MMRRLISILLVTGALLALSATTQTQQPSALPETVVACTENTCMHVDDINGAMFRFGGGAYIVPDANPALEAFFIYRTEHYLQRIPRAARFNEF